MQIPLIPFFKIPFQLIYFLLKHSFMDRNMEKTNIISCIWSTGGSNYLRLKKPQASSHHSIQDYLREEKSNVLQILKIQRR